VLEQAAPWVFLAFVLLFGWYRWALVRAGKYPAFKAFFQVGAGVLFFTLLLPGARDVYEPPPEESDVVSLLSHPEARVRAIAAELSRYRPASPELSHELVKALKDSDRNVRREAHESLVEIHGSDLGDPERPGGVEAWEKQY
jgi:hypothetical protein